MNLLVVEDNPGDARLLHELLRSGLEPPPELVTANTLQDAREALVHHEIDCALVDLALPDADGLEVVDVMATDASSVPLVIISGRNDEAFAVRAVQAGAQDYLIKGGFDPESVARTVRYAIERKRLDRELAALALYDPLTGLPNRALFMDRLGMALARAAEGRGSFVVLQLDLDGFRTVNDRMGYDVGDAVLIEVAQRLKSALSPADTLARLGGDTFGVISEITADPQVHLLTGRLLDRLSGPITVGRDSTEVTASMGYAFGRGTERAEELIQRAAVAMHLDKGRATPPG